VGVLPGLGVGAFALLAPVAFRVVAVGPDAVAGQAVVDGRLVGVGARRGAVAVGVVVVAAHAVGCQLVGGVVTVGGRAAAVERFGREPAGDVVDVGRVADRSASGVPVQNVGRPPQRIVAVRRRADLLPDSGRHVEADHAGQLIGGRVVLVD